MYKTPFTQDVEVDLRTNSHTNLFMLLACCVKHSHAQQWVLMSALCLLRDAPQDCERGLSCTERVHLAHLLIQDLFETAGQQGILCESTPEHRDRSN